MVFDVREMKESLVKLAEFIAKPVKAAISFNNLGFNMELHAGKNIWEELNIPCVNILMDHPFCYHSAMAAAPANGVVLCVDRNHMKYIERFYPNIPVIGYLPHGGREIKTDRKPIKERSIDVLYAGGLSRDFAKNILPDFTKYQTFDVKEICKKTYEYLVANPQETTEDALEKILLENNIRLEDMVLREVIADLHFIDLYVTSYYREKTIKILAENGIQIALYGYGWENCEWINRSNVFYGGRVAADDIIEKMQDAKIVLSTMTWFKDGTHDRVFNGMLQGAVTVSDSSKYMREEFCENDMLLFELAELEQLPEQIKGILQDIDNAQKIADNGYAKAMQKHTWKARANELEEGLFQ